ncbi:unnamed protein product [Phytomonas sp. EM1]|nr:unnamed protein product [Phytomonas sp. EM1]|eukprot:CCW64389.1 unnamed protein product [Phytomonas sp. isolate EM1]
MSNSIAEEFKLNGNKAFAEKRFEDAVLLYSQAIEHDPENFIYYSNRAAAHQELRNYDEAIRDAKKSISIKDTVKAHVRVATALWAQRKLEEASAEYKLALSLDSSNQGVKNSLKILEELLEAKRSSYRSTPPSASTAPNVMMNGAPLPPPAGGEFTSAPPSDAGAALAVIVLFVSLLFSLSCILRPVLMNFFWHTLICALIVQHGVNLYSRGLIPHKMDDLQTWARQFSSLMLLVSITALLLKVPPQLFFGSFSLIYDIVDLSNHKSRILAWAGRFQNIILPYINSAEANRYHLLLIAASFETMAVISVMLTSGALFTLAYIQYIKTRYVYDRYVQAAFSNMRLKITTLTSASFMPPIVNVYAQKFFDLLYMMSQQTV